jgi:hypothetical protein
VAERIADVGEARATPLAPRSTPVGGSDVDQAQVGLEVDSPSSRARDPITIVLDGAPIGDDALDGAGRFANLHAMYLSRTRVTDAALSADRLATNLRVLYLAWGGSRHETPGRPLPATSRPLMTPSLTHRVWWLIAVLGLSAVAISGQEKASASRQVSWGVAE